MKIVFPENTTEIIDSIRDAIGRPVTFLVENKVICSSCGGIDPNTGFSADPFCTVCSGLGYYSTYSGVDVIAHITWGGVDELNWTRGGYEKLGDCRIQIKFTEQNKNLAGNAKYVIIDNRRTRKIRVIPRGFKGINRLIIDCQLDEIGG
jgi:hypothetical protein